MHYIWHCFPYRLFLFVKYLCVDIICYFRFEVCFLRRLAQINLRIVPWFFKIGNIFAILDWTSPRDWNTAHHLADALFKSYSKFQVFVLLMVIEFLVYMDIFGVFQLQAQSLLGRIVSARAHAPLSRNSAPTPPFLVNSVKRAKIAFRAHT